MTEANVLAAILGNDDIVGFANRVSANNIWSQLSPALSGVRFNSDTWSPQEKFGTSLAQAFISSALGKIGENQVSSQVSKMADLLPNLYKDPASVTRPEGIDENAFNYLKATSAVKNIQREALKNERLEELLSQVGIEDAKAKIAAKYAGEKVKNEKLGELGAYGSDGANTSLMNPLTKAQKEEEDARRSEILKLPTATSLQKMTSVLPLLDTYSKDDTGTSDIPFIYKFVQAQDGGIVKEGEFDLVAGANPLVKKYSAQLNQALNGQSALTPAIKQQMVREMKKAAKEQFSAFGAEAEPFFLIGEGRGAKRSAMNPFADTYMEKLLQDSPALDQYTPQQIEYMKAKGIIK